MKKIRNIHDLKLMKARLKYREKLQERDFADSATSIIDYANTSMRNLAFDIGTEFVMRLFSFFTKEKDPDKEDS